jgi:S-adenosylmethionine:tRNA ribosyltransferase-isomerase
MSDQLADYLYHLPEELITDRPAPKREDSRMMVLERSSGKISHHGFSDFASFVGQEDLVVLNDSRVIPARLHDVSGKIELLLLEKRSPTLWIAMGKPGKKLRKDTVIEIAGTTARVSEVLVDGRRLIDFATTPDLEQHGEMPIPPYFHRLADEQDRLRYQTVYASDPGSVAAPTAGLHFTPEILSRFDHAFVTLHVGAGTFQPVKHDDLTLHRMHGEQYTISRETAHRINQSKENGGRIIAVGTTTARVLESQPSGPLSARSGSTDIFIRPPQKPHRFDSLLTNFHLPASTLLMLVSAFADREFILDAYAEAVRQKYRFFSYGDCMLIL